jgi:hypothetical protein
LENGDNGALEVALAKTEADAGAALEAAENFVRHLKRLRLATNTGNLREVRRTIDSAEKSLSSLMEQFARAKEGWNFDEEAYFSGKGFFLEVLAAASEQGLSIFEQDERLYCYPFLVRLLGGERCVLVDKTRERRLRPSFLAKHLKALQNKPPRFRPEAFLEGIFEAYKVALLDKPMGAPISLLEIHRILTLFPGQSREYPRQEFARDVCLLDQSRLTRTKKGYGISFPASTGTKSLQNTLRVITAEGLEKKYYAVAFREEQEGECSS